MLILEPIFEADMPQEQHAYRQNRNAQSAVREVRGKRPSMAAVLKQESRVLGIGVRLFFVAVEKLGATSAM
jgi:hypothetical protein